jgi:hypothetical protein
MTDDYAKFFDARCRAISRELGKLIIPQEIDQLGTAKSAEETVVEQEEWLASRRRIGPRCFNWTAIKQ